VAAVTTVATVAAMAAGAAVALERAAAVVIVVPAVAAVTVRLRASVPTTTAGATEQVVHHIANQSTRHDGESFRHACSATSGLVARLHNQYPGPIRFTVSGGPPEQPTGRNPVQCRGTPEMA
jgi:hypothetical protein